jgi:glycosyltransferase involved in cell wall biosynthesis
MTLAQPTEWPSVEVLVPTHDRQQMLEEALAAVRSQDYPGELSVAVIFDRQAADDRVVTAQGVPVRVLSNFRSPGLPGARNSGILTSSADFVAFCDDDDCWLPGKLMLQIQRWQSEPDVKFLTTSIMVCFRGRQLPRRAGIGSVPHSRLLESRMAMLHSSTFVIDRRYLTDQIGLVAESAPDGQNEDWELLLRASRERPIAHVDEPLVAVRWGGTSMFARSWESKIAAAEWLLERFPAIRDSRVGYARVLGQIAFAHATLGHRRAALRWALRAQRSRPLEARAYLAMAVAAGLPPEVVLEALHRHGHGV